MLALLLIGLSALVYAESIQLQVLERGTGRALRRVEVRVGDKPYFTDAEGKVEVSFEETDKAVLIDRSGFRSEVVARENLKPDEVNKFFLYPDTPNNNEVTIRGDRRKETSKKIVDVREAETVAPSGDAAQVTKLLPGAQSSAFGNQVAIRGSGPNDSAYYIDRFQVFSIFHPIGGISVIPNSLLDSVEYYAGGFSPRFGDATGGVIVLGTRNDIPERTKTELTLNVPFYSGVFHERALSENSALFVGARYSYLQYILPSLLPKDLGATIIPYFTDAQVMYLNKDKESGAYTKALALLSQDGAIVAFPFDESTKASGQEEINFDRRYVTFGVERFQPMKDGWAYVAAPQLLYDRSRIFFFGDYVNWDSYSARLHFELSKRFDAKRSWYLGVEPSFGYFYANMKVPLVSNDPANDDRDNAPRVRITDRINFSDQAAWTSYDVFLFDRLLLSPGARYFYASIIDKSTIDPRLLMRLTLTDKHDLKSTVGQYSRAPDPQKASPKFGNPDLGFEHSMHYVLGLESNWSSFWDTDVQIFYKYTRDLAVVDVLNNYSNYGSRKSIGAELFVRRNLTDRAFGWVSYTYSKNQERQRDQDPWYDSDFDQTHVATVVGSYALTGQWRLGGRVTYRTGDTYTPIQDSVYDASKDKYLPREREEDKNSKRLPDFHQADIYSTYAFLYQTWSMDLKLGVEFLALEKQAVSSNYNYDYSKQVENSTIPPIPYIEVRATL
jgi:hypothetical protein